MRWRSGRFSADDLRFARQWRESASSTDLETMKREVPKPPFRAGSIDELARLVEVLLETPEFQKPMLDCLLNLLKCDTNTTERVCVRWKFAINRSLSSFAPYAFHCLRVHVIYCIGMAQGFFSTRPTNIVDLEYLWYTPFASIFCSGDKLHEQLCPVVLQSDQSFVRQNDLRTALCELAEARTKSSNAVPREGSLIRELWIAHRRKPPMSADRRPLTEQERNQLMEAMKPIVDVLQNQEMSQPRRFPL